MLSIAKDLRRGAVLLLLALLLFVTPRTLTDSPNSGRDALGRGWVDGVACVGCLTGAIALIAGGAPALVVAVNYPGGVLIAASCGIACYRAVQ
jgi:hypothetical protein